ncbi:MAG TPA: redoxin domain-containing protein [Rubrobacteraceae bacterium]|nr:redoxin domain-containing protein [Rubrobacteraceae bacterium]
MFTRSKTMPVPEVGAEAPEFNLPSAQGGQLRLSMRTVRGPVVVAFYRPWSEEDVAYFRELAAKEDEINLAAGSVAAIGVAEPDEAREFARASGLKSYVLYDYARVTSRQWGLLEREKERGDYTRPAVFIVGPDGKVVHAWSDERPSAEELLSRVSEITGLPKPAEEPKSEKTAGDAEPAAEGAEAEAKPAPKKLTAEEREKIKAERRAAREAGKSLKTSQPEKADEGGAEGAAASDAPKKMSREERERIKAERRAARESGQSLKAPQPGKETGAGAAGAEPAGAEPAGAEPAGAEPAGDGDDAPKKMSREERERIKAERRAAREAGLSLKTGGEAPRSEAADTPKPGAKDPDAGAGRPRDTSEAAKAAATASGTADDGSAEGSKVRSEASETGASEPAQAEVTKAEPVEGEAAAVDEKESRKKTDGKPAEE